jgi:hypothetical protein
LAAAALLLRDDFLTLTVLYLWGFGVGFWFDFNEIAYEKSNTNNLLAWGLTLNDISLLTLGLFWVFVYYYNESYSD